MPVEEVVQTSPWTVTPEAGEGTLGTGRFRERPWTLCQEYRSP